MYSASPKSVVPWFKIWTNHCHRVKCLKRKMISGVKQIFSGGYSFRNFVWSGHLWLATCIFQRQHCLESASKVECSGKRWRRLTRLGYLGQSLNLKLLNICQKRFILRFSLVNLMKKSGLESTFYFGIPFFVKVVVTVALAWLSALFWDC